MVIYLFIIKGTTVFCQPHEGAGGNRGCAKKCS